MGKAQYKKKTAPKRHNPIRVPDAHLGGGRAEGKANPTKERQMLPILDKVGGCAMLVLTPAQLARVR